MSNQLPQNQPIECGPERDPVHALKQLPARKADLGAGLIVRRSLPSRARRMVGPWCFLDHYGPLDFARRKAMDVAPHPHIGLQTVSWLFSGEVVHDDSLGSQAIARPGQLNLMTAGAGIAHAEQTPARHSGHLHGLQLWVALPEARRHGAARFDHYRDLPVWEPGGGSVTVFMGRLGAVDSKTEAFSPLVGADVAVGAHGRMALPLQPGWEYAVLPIDGDLEAGGKALEASSLYVLETPCHGLELASRHGARAILIGGEPFPEDIVMWWNFVARTADEIAAARADWQAHRRFGEVAAYRGPRLDAPVLAGRPVARR